MSSAQDGSTRQERRKAQTRARIAVAANELFAANGYEMTSMDDISTAADVGLLGDHAAGAEIARLISRGSV
jgi:hypothetical protein